MRRVKGQAGFTLIEVLIVVVIISVAGAIVVPQMLAPSSMGVQAAGRIIIADIMFAQNDAVAHQRVRKVIFDAPNDRYELTDAADVPITVNWMAGGQYEVSIAGDSRFEGVTIENINFGGGSVLEFDDLGAPITGGTLDVIGATAQYRITVAGLTGRVTIEPI